MIILSLYPLINKINNKELIMNNKHNFIINLGRICAVLVVLVAFSCKEDALDDHYGQEDQRLESTILEA